MKLIDSSKHFPRYELVCKCGCDQALMSEHFMWRLEAIRKEFGKPMRLTSAYRCPDYNDRIARSGRDGPHTTGRAIDVAVAASRAVALQKVALAYGMTGFGVRQHGAYKSRFLHLDDLPKAPGRPRPHIWTGYA